MRARDGRLIETNDRPYLIVQKEKEGKKRVF